MNKNKVIFIVGPTASGKSDMAMSIAKTFDCEIISCDSMQIYKGLNIGTAKESEENRQKVKHYLIDVVNFDEEFSVAQFQKLAFEAMDEIWQKGKTPLIVGGTGLYVESLLKPLSFSNTDKDTAIREQLKNDLEKYGAVELFRRLSEVDSETAKKLSVNDTKRVIRALEIFYKTGKPKSQLQDETQKPNFDYLMIALDMDRALLYERINKRVDNMIMKGLVQEAMSVDNLGYQSMQAIGYKEFKDYNGFNLIEVTEKIKKNTRNYAKRQLTWFRRYKEANWINAFDELTASKLVENFLKS